ncbi:hypothetical protein MetMK1DRAFT_00032960 [Metallosphaera yellowstonensis MK1]|jgi:hypothetical protein|uniref:Uncharacterized protein n=1 Tax=Metallosphaera yellowstonensis MK1 TaxID=671065 RepID=H2C9M4_9CREN|nr:hypothetical protein MetMK1DRAFT_00032960 [Metallosphaera yellowstonensis MK1]
MIIVIAEVIVKLYLSSLTTYVLPSHNHVVIY